LELRVVPNPVIMKAVRRDSLFSNDIVGWYYRGYLLINAIYLGSENIVTKASSSSTNISFYWSFFGDHFTFNSQITDNNNWSPFLFGEFSSNRFTLELTVTM